MCVARMQRHVKKIANKRRRDRVWTTMMKIMRRAKGVRTVAK